METSAVNELTSEGGKEWTTLGCVVGRSRAFSAKEKKKAKGGREVFHFNGENPKSFSL